MAIEKEETMTENKEWFVRMSNGTVFGPINTIGLTHWAADGRVMPDDEVSTDRTNWMSACDLDELGMITMIELPDGSFKGPYNPKAIEILAQEGKIPMRAVRFHKRELEERKANRQISLFGDEAWEQPEATQTDVASSGIVEKLEQELEQVRQEAKDAIELAQREADDLRVEREQLLSENEALVAEKATLEAELEVAKQQNTDATQEPLPNNQEQIDALTAEKASLERALESANQQLAINAQLIDDIIAEKTAIEEAKTALEAELAASKQNAVEQDVVENAALRNECDELRNQAQLLAQQLAASENERDSFAEKLKEMETIQIEAIQNAPEPEPAIPVAETEEYLTLLAEKNVVETALEETKQLVEQVTSSLESAVKAHEEDVAEKQELNKKIDELQEQATNLSAELAIAKENNDLSKELLALAEGAKKELTDALSAELTKVEELTAQIATAEEKCATAEEKSTALNEELTKLKQSNDSALEELAQLQEEYSELLDFSNTRDTEHNELVATLKKQLEERPDVVQSRREQMLEEQLKDAISEADTLRSQLENISAQKMTEDNYTEDDISLIKRFADESINVLRKTLEEEKEANLAARSKSIERQRVLHEELQRLERVMQRDPGELTRAEMSEQRANKQIAKLQQELEAERRHHQADVARGESNAAALEQRYRMLMQKETALREQLSAAESRSADFESVNNLLKRREMALLAAEKEFEEARQQWKMTEETLQRRIEELENGAGLLFDNRELGGGNTNTKPSPLKTNLSHMVLHK